MMLSGGTFWSTDIKDQRKVGISGQLLVSFPLAGGLAVFRGGFPLTHPKAGPGETTRKNLLADAGYPPVDALSIASKPTASHG